MSLWDTTLGTASYGNVVFNGTTRTLGVDVTPVYDTSGRIVKYTVFSITLETWIKATQTTADGDVLSIRRTLESPGLPFIYTSHGLGDISVNTGDGVQDVMWGPRPKILKWSTPGGAIAVHLVWTCEVGLPDCSNAIYQFGILELVTRIGFSIDARGYTRRTVRGHVCVPMTLVNGSRVLPDSADGYRDRVMPDVPEKCRRVQRDFDLNEAKDRCDFTIVDEEVASPNFYPPGVVRAKVSQEHSNSKPFVFSDWQGSISGEFEMAPA